MGTGGVTRSLFAAVKKTIIFWPHSESLAIVWKGNLSRPNLGGTVLGSHTWQTYSVWHESPGSLVALTGVVFISYKTFTSKTTLLTKLNCSYLSLHDNKFCTEPKM